MVGDAGRFDPGLGAPEECQALHAGADRRLVIAGAAIAGGDDLEECRPAPGIELIGQPVRFPQVGDGSLAPTGSHLDDAQGDEDPDMEQGVGHGGQTHRVEQGSE